MQFDTRTLLGRGLPALTLIAAAALSACGVGNAEQPTPPAQLPEIPVATALVQSIAPTHQYPARIEAIDRVELRPRVSGSIEAILFQEGAIVAKDQELVRIDARPYRARLAEVDATLALARAELSLARQEHERAQRLVQKNAIAVQELDRRAAAVAASQARVAAANAARDAAALDASFTVVRAPIAGRIGRAEVTAGNLVSANQGGGTLLAVLVSIDPVYATFDVAEGAIAQAVAQGDAALPVRFAPTGASSDDIVGELSFIDNELGRGTGTLRARARLHNPEGRLVPGMLGRASLALGARSDALLVDEKAIGTDQGRRFVLVANGEGTLEYRPVTVGPRVGALRVIEQGLAAAEPVVVNGLMRVRPGAVIKPVPVSMERAAVGDYTPVANVLASQER